MFCGVDLELDLEDSDEGQAGSEGANARMRRSSSASLYSAVFPVNGGCV